jgi:hypothetical protein
MVGRLCLTSAMAMAMAPVERVKYEVLPIIQNGEVAAESPELDTARGDPPG